MEEVKPYMDMSIRKILASGATAATLVFGGAAPAMSHGVATEAGSAQDDVNQDVFVNTDDGSENNNEGFQGNENEGDFEDEDDDGILDGVLDVLGDDEEDEGNEDEGQGNEDEGQGEDDDGVLDIL